MSTQNKIYKETLSCRLSPRLRKEIQNEATENSLTTSNYIETILKKRNLILTEEERQAITLENQHLENLVSVQNIELEEERVEKETYVDVLRETEIKLDAQQKETQILKQQLSKLRETSITFDSSQLEIFNEYIHQLRENYPEVESGNLVIASLKASIENEDSIFFIHLIKGQLK